MEQKLELKFNNSFFSKKKLFELRISARMVKCRKLLLSGHRKLFLVTKVGFGIEFQNLIGNLN